MGAMLGCLRCLAFFCDINSSSKTPSVSEVESSKNIKCMRNKHSTIDLEEDNDPVIVIPLWETRVDLSKFEQSERVFDMEWAQGLPRLIAIEYKHFPTLVSRKFKAKTVCVHFFEGKPYYVRRRSTKDHQYTWLAKVNEYSLLSYQKKQAAWREKEEILAQKRLVALEETEQGIVCKKKISRHYLLVLNEAYAADRARIVETVREKWAQEKAKVKDYTDTCMYHANAWLYGHAPESLRNSEEWQLAEKEETELMKQVSKSLVV
jgi:hypothetical protein